MSFFKNFLRLCEEKGVKPTTVVVELGLARGAVTKWKNGTLPNKTTLPKLADYFGVSTGAFFQDIDIKKDLAQGEVEDGYYLLANRDGEGKGIEKLTKSEYEALMAVIKTLRHNTNEDL